MNASQFPSWAREYFDECEYTVNERPDTHAHFKKLVELLKAVYQYGFTDGAMEGK